MKMKMGIITGVTLAVIVAVFVINNKNSQIDCLEEIVKDVKTELSSKSSNTEASESDIIIVPTLESELSDAKSSVWCATLQLAWDKTNELLGEKISMVNQPPEVDVLNNNPYPKNCIDPKLYYAGAGFIRDGFYEKMMTDLKLKFPQIDFTTMITPPNPNSRIYSFSYLNANLPFSQKFIPLQDERKFKGSRGEYTVDWFGFKPEDQDAYNGCAATLIDWKNDENFTIGLYTKIEGERIVLVKAPEPKNMNELIKRVASQITTRKMLVNGGHNITLMIPKISFNTSHLFDQFCHKPFTTSNPNKLSISSLKQKIKFNLDESGAEVESYCSMEITDSAPQEAKERNYIFDKPFMVLLWRVDAKLPYLALWVNKL